MTTEQRHLERLTASDLFLLMWDDYGWSSDIGGLAILDGTSLLDPEGRVRIEAIRQRLEPRLHVVPASDSCSADPRGGWAGRSGRVGTEVPSRDEDVRLYRGRRVRRTLDARPPPRRRADDHDRHRRAASDGRTVIGSAIGEWNYYLVGSAIEVAQLAAIAYYAWSWPKVAAQTAATPRQAAVVGANVREAD